MRSSKTDFVLLFLAWVLILLCLSRPTIPLKQEVFHYLFILDITQSMNTSDYHAGNLPADRLSFAKLALRHAVRTLPCGSHAGIGLFSTKDVLLLIEPIEICSHFAAIDDTIDHIDWRMAWSADSNIERGLYGGMLATKNLRPETRLVFMSDGEQTIQELHRPPLVRYSGSIEGFLFGVGGISPTPIPKLDKDNRISGYWTNVEVDEFSIGMQSLERSAQKFSDPGQAYLSSLRESNLQTLAAMSGLHYHRLESPEQFTKQLQSPEMADSQKTQTDLRGFFASISLILLLAIYVDPLIRNRTSEKKRGSASQ